MGDVVAKIRILPNEGVDLDRLKDSLSFAKIIEEKPFVFGLKVLEILVRVPDAEGGLSNIEKQIESNELVSSYELLEVGRL
ncbi:MAG: elongation factor 1-beta [Candidatus Altiarchaeota archaeon]|nr:elongation factor 1-beta [Candidatus Altiarchaeota archaeon]